MGTWESSETPETLEFDCKGQNTLHWGVLYIIGKLLKCRCRKWARMSHLNIWSTSYGKKKGSGVKLTIWFPTTKSQESTQPGCVQKECHTPLESFWQELPLCFKPHPNRRSEQRVIVSQSCMSPKLWQFRDSSLGVSGQKDIRMWVPRGGIENILRGRWCLPLSLGPGESCESKVACGLS
jgi:hypothetical protein